jgi:hypothetical protein
MRIWKVTDITVDALNQQSKGTLVEHLGIEMTELGDDFVKAKMPVDNRTTATFGFVAWRRTCGTGRITWKHGGEFMFRYH